MLQTANIERVPPPMADTERIRPPTPGVERVPPPPANVTPHPEFDEDEKPKRGGFGRAVLLYGFCILLGVGAAFGWRSYSSQLTLLYGQVKAQVAAKINATRVATSGPQTATPAPVPQNTAAAAPSAPPAPAPQPATAATPQTPAAAAPGSAALAAQLDHMAAEIAEMKKSIGQLAGMQQGMRQSIAAIQTEQAALQRAASAQQQGPSHWLADATAFATVRSIYAASAPQAAARPQPRTAVRR